VVPAPAAEPAWDRDDDRGGRHFAKSSRSRRRDRSPGRRRT
jgi:hypothetical protein